MVLPWNAKPVMNPILPIMVPPIRLIILEQISLPTAADRLFPDTNRERRKIYMTSKTVRRCIHRFTELETVIT